MPPGTPLASALADVGKAPPKTATLIGSQIVDPESYLGPIPTLTIVLTPYDQARNAEACTAFRTLQSYSDLIAANPSSTNVIPLRWPSDRHIDQDSACNILLQNFNYFEAAELLSRVASSTTTASGQKLDISGPGPFIIEQIATDKGITYAVIDMSKVPTGNLQFNRLAASLTAAITYQTVALSGGSAQKAMDAATAAAPTAPKPTGWLADCCGALDSVYGKVILAGLSFIPAATIPVTVVNALDKAACPEKAAAGAADAAVAKQGKAKKKA